MCIINHVCYDCDSVKKLRCIYCNNLLFFYKGIKSSKNMNKIMICVYVYSIFCKCLVKRRRRKTYNKVSFESLQHDLVFINNVIYCIKLKRKISK